jgi:hypothetical protein
MKQEQQKLLNLMFREGESICVSPNQYAYHSVKIEDLEKGVTLVSPNEKVKDSSCDWRDITLLAINPIEGFRCDNNVTHYRNFLIELDDGDLLEQHNYIRQSGIPYSACIYSGNKSLHFIISLEEDLLSYQMYYNVAEWILNVLDRADKVVKNPSRCVRFPCNVRKETNKEQTLVEFKGNVKNKDLYDWLSKHPSKMPVEKKMHKPISSYTGTRKIPEKVVAKLKEGIDSNRNNTWFHLSSTMAQAGFDYEETLDIFYNFFEPEKDFKEYEWKNAIKNGGKQYWM